MQSEATQRLKTCTLDRNEQVEGGGQTKADGRGEHECGWVKGGGEMVAVGASSGSRSNSSSSCNRGSRNVNQSMNGSGSSGS